MITLLLLPEDIWCYLFQEKFLSVHDLRSLSGVCTQLYHLAHNITTFRTPTCNPFEHQDRVLEPLKKVCVKAWENVAFVKYIPTPIIIKPDFHYIFHTWEDCPNVYFHLFSTRYINFEKVVQKFLHRIYYYHCQGESVPQVIDIPYFSFTGNLPSISSKGDRVVTPRVKILKIGFSEIRDLSPFKFVRELIINISSNIDLSSLRGGRVKKISILDCDIDSLEGVQDIEDVEISGRNRVTDFGPISKIPRLALIGTYIHDLEFIKNTQELDISESVNLTDIYCLKDVPNLKRVTAWRTRWILGFQELREKGVEVIR